MSTHISSFGMYGEDLRPFTDLNGYIPSASDFPEDFMWAHDAFDGHHDGDSFALEAWEEFVTAACVAIEEAGAALDAWREQ